MAEPLPEQSVVVYRVGLCYASACTEVSDADTVAHVNSEHPTGLDHGWQVSSDATFASGEPNPSPCNKWPDARRHVLLECWPLPWRRMRHPSPGSSDYGNRVSGGMRRGLSRKPRGRSR